MKELTAMLDACAEYRAKLDELERENAALRAELEAQAVVNGKGGEREAKLRAEVAKLQGCVDRVSAANNLLLAEKTALRNELARLNGQTNWVCKCGGTDCAGRRENEELRKQLEQWKRSSEWLEGWAAQKQELEKENATLRAHADKVGAANDKLFMENLYLGKDKQRLDFLESPTGSLWVSLHLGEGGSLTRKEIDRRRATEVQP